MVQPISLAKLYNDAPRPFFFSYKDRRVRLSGHIFAYDYNSIGRFYYVILDIGLENQVLYKVPDFFKPITFFSKDFSVRLRYTPEHAFLLKQSFFCEELFSSSIVGYFPLTFFNSYMLSAGWAKSSLEFQSLSFAQAFIKGGIGGVKSVVDTHLSIFFGIRAFFFPTSYNFISTFGYMVPHVYLILGEHNVPVFTFDSNANSLVAKALQLRYYRAKFFKQFFQGLKIFFLQQFFRSSVTVVTPLALAQLSFFFSYYQKFVVNVLRYFSYIKLYLNASVFCFFYGSCPSLFVTLRFFLVEFLYGLFLSNPGHFALGVSSFVRRWFFRNLVYKVLRFFFVPNYSSIAAALLEDFSFKKAKNFKSNAYVFNDLTFLKGAGLSLGLRFSQSYRQFVSRWRFTPRKAARALCGKRRVFVPRPARRRWVNRVHGYYRRKRRTRWFRWLFVQRLNYARRSDLMFLRSSSGRRFRRSMFYYKHKRKRRRLILRKVDVVKDNDLPGPFFSSISSYFKFRSKGFFLRPNFRVFNSVRTSEFRLPLNFLELHFYQAVAQRQRLNSLGIFHKKRVSVNKDDAADGISPYRLYLSKSFGDVHGTTDTGSQFIAPLQRLVIAEKHRRLAELREKRAREVELKAIRENWDVVDEFFSQFSSDDSESESVDAEDAEEEVEDFLSSEGLALENSYTQGTGLPFKCEVLSTSTVKFVYLTRRLVSFLAFFFGIPKRAIGRPYSCKFFRFRLSSFLKLRKLLLRRRGFKVTPFCARKRLLFNGAQGSSFSFALRRLYRSYLRRHGFVKLKSKKRTNLAKNKRRIFFNKRNFSKLYSFCFFFEPYVLPKRFYVKDLSISLNVLFLKTLLEWLNLYGIFSIFQDDFRFLFSRFFSVSVSADALNFLIFFFFYRRFLLVRNFVSFLIRFLKGRLFLENGLLALRYGKVNEFRVSKYFFRYLCVFFKFRRLKFFRQRKVKVVFSRVRHRNKRRSSFNFKRFYKFGKSRFRRNR